MKLLDICEVIVDCPHSTAKDEGKGYPLIRTPNVGKGRLKLDGVHRVSEQVYNQRNERTVPKAGDLILAREAPVGNVAIIRQGQQICLGQRTVLIRPNNKCVDPDFLVYYLLSPELQHKLLSSSNGATVSHLNMSSIRSLEVQVPDIEVQKRIGAILARIDDKIELNTAVNENLEQQAQALFRAWFVDFEPFGGVMPDDWIATNLGSVTNNIRTKIMNNSTPVFSAVNSGNLVHSDEFFSKQVYSKDISKYVVVDNWNFAYNPARINIGSIGINDLGVIGCVSPVYVVFSVQAEYHGFFRFFFRQEAFKQQALVRASGSVRQTLNYTDFSLIDIVYPTKEYAQRFDAIWKSYFSVIVRLRKENEKLAELRDSLLPKLMNGEIDVSAIKI